MSTSQVNMQDLQGDLLTKTKSSEAIIGQLLNLKASSVDSQMLKIILLKRITISILSGLLNNQPGNNNSQDPFGMAGLFSLPMPMPSASVQ